jgi:tripartite-type tricarboxylate transporter receptor subunit TctC
MWMAILDPVTAPPPVRAGKIKAYAVTAMTHLPAAPDVPTVDEAGLPGLHMAPWHGIWAPKSTAKAITSRLNAAAKPERAPAHRRSRKWKFLHASSGHPMSARLSEGGDRKVAADH